MEKVKDERKHIIKSDSKEDQHFSFLAGKRVVGIKHCLCHSVLHMELFAILRTTK